LLQILIYQNASVLTTRILVIKYFLMTKSIKTQFKDKLLLNTLSIQVAPMGPPSERPEHRKKIGGKRTGSALE